MTEEPKPEREYALTSDKVCPHDGTELRVEKNLGVIFNPMGETYRTCPSCGRKFRSSLLLDGMMSPIMQIGRQIQLSTLPAWLGTTAPSTKRIEEAREDNADVQRHLNEFSNELKELKSSLPPDRSSEVDALQKIVESVQGRVADTTTKLDEAKAELIGLMPDQTEIAYMKLARIEVKDLRDLLEKHIDNDHKGEAVVQLRKQLTQAKVGLAVAMFAAVVAAAVAIFKP
jgi:hypothetical protein